MKTINIPKRFGYPTVDISINGKKYTFKSGMDVNIGDGVAKVIENALALEPKPNVTKRRIGSLIDRSITEITTDDWDGVTNIRENAFYGCTNLIKVNIPNKVVDVEYHAFANCTNLNSITFGDGVTKVAPSFGKCNNLINITIGRCVKNVIANSFGGLTPELSSVSYTFKSATPPSISADSLHQSKYIKKIAVPRGYAEAYKSATNWSEYANLIVEE